MAASQTCDAQRHSTTEPAALDLSPLVSGANIPSAPSPRLECCCGRSDCASQQHGKDAMGKVLNDLQVAAQVGQALLARHEAYVCNAEQERLQANKTIEQLEAEKRKLAAENSKAIEENRDLLCQLEELNGALAESEAHTKTLTATLEATETKVQQLSIVASRAKRLEMQLEALELEHAELQQTVIVTKEQERSADQCWRKAEKALAALQLDIECVEKDAAAEHERYIELLGRLERRRAVELELDNASKGAKRHGSTRHERQTQTSLSVVPQFVSDILQDNANLQTDILELRERLLDAQEDTDHLRQQLVAHEAITPSHVGSLQSLSLARDIELVSSKAGAHEVHVHHNFQDPGPSKGIASIHQPREHTTVAGLPRSTNPSKERRAQVRLPIRAHTERSLAAAAILSRTSVSVPVASPVATRSRLSAHTVQSDSTGMSHLSSSPLSSEIFDQAIGDTALSSSQPTSPDSAKTLSPIRAPLRRIKPKQLTLSEALAPAFSHSPLPTNSSEDHTTTAKNVENDSLSGEESSHNELPLQSFNANTGRSGTGKFSTKSANIPDDGSHRQGLRRTSSRDTLLSVSGMDIHTLKHRPSQLVVTGDGLFPKATFSASSPSTALTSDQPVLGAMVTASRPSLAPSGSRTSAYSYVSSQGNQHAGGARANLAAMNAENKGKYGKRLGDWVWARLGSGPTRSNGKPPNSQEPSLRTDEKKAIKGQGSVSKGTAPVVVTEVDEENLRECLLES